METTLAPTTTLTTRVLPPAEWPRLNGTEAEQLWPLLDPTKAQVMVVERDGAIVGCWTLMTVLHAECLWIAEADRGRVSVARRLLRLMKTLARDAGFCTVATAADSDAVRALLAHVHAYQLPGAHYVFRVDGGSPCL